MRRELLFFAILFMLGCTTVEFVRKDTTPQKKGVLRYPLQSSTQGEAKHREELTKKATEFCGGEFDIIREYQAREESGVSTGVGTGFGVGMGGILVGTSRRGTTMSNFVEIACKNSN